MASQATADAFARMDILETIAKHLSLAQPVPMEFAA